MESSSTVQPHQIRTSDLWPLAEDEPFVYTWMRVVRRIRLGRTVKAVAAMLATYANPADGTRVFPGIARLSHECELSYTSVKSALRALRKAGLIVKVGKKGDADEYHLIFHDDLAERVSVPTPAQSDLEIECIRAALTAEGNAAEESAVIYSTFLTESAVIYSNSLRSTPPPAKYQEEPPTKKDHSSEDLSEELTVSRAMAPETENDIEIEESDEDVRDAESRTNGTRQHPNHQEDQNPDRPESDMDNPEEGDTQSAAMPASSSRCDDPTCHMGYRYDHTKPRGQRNIRCPECHPRPPQANIIPVDSARSGSPLKLPPGTVLVNANAALKQSLEAERPLNPAHCRTHRGQPVGNCGLCRSERIGSELGLSSARGVPGGSR